MELNNPLPDRKPHRLDTFDYSQNGSYFVTICTRDRAKILSELSVGTGLPDCPLPTSTAGVRLLLYGQVAEKYIRQMGEFYSHISVDKYVIMPDHIHLLLTVHGQSGRPVPTKIDNTNSTISRFVGTFKRFCNKEYGKNIWQDRYYDHVVRNQEDYNSIWEYIDGNPVKWQQQHNKSQG